MLTPQTCSVNLNLEARYLLHVPEPLDSPLLVLTLHGYGSTPEAMLRLTVPTVGPQHIVAALEAPFAHYVDKQTVGFNWGVRTHHAEAVRLHQQFVLAVRDQLRARFHLHPHRTVLIGFSQSVGLNYRLIGAHPEAAGAVIAICGGVPNDWEHGGYRPVPTPILHISRDADEVYPAATAAQFPARLKAHASNVEFQMIPGAHRFPSNAARIVQPWLARVFGPAG